MAEPELSSANPQGSSVRRGPGFTPLHAFFVTFVAAAGCLFFYKLHAFLATIERDELAGFAFDPILVYAFVAMGFLLLLVWAFATGQFRDIERPKHEMLARFEQQERAEGLWLDDRPERAGESDRSTEERER